MELKDFNDIEKATQKGRREFFRLGCGLLFVVGIMIYTALGIGITGQQGIMLVIAAMIGGYMAMNIGANDVANNVGPGRWFPRHHDDRRHHHRRHLRSGWRLIAGGDVVSTIRGGIINPDAIADTDRFIWLMMAALLAGRAVAEFRYRVGAPVSTTHSIVGAVLGAGVAAGGMGAANWGTMGSIAASWVISPLLGGGGRCGLPVLDQALDHLQERHGRSAQRKPCPILIGLMAFPLAPT
jgi:inorganic phosphate transporter, PiT family